MIRLIVPLLCLSLWAWADSKKISRTSGESPIGCSLLGPTRGCRAGALLPEKVILVAAVKEDEMQDLLEKESESTPRSVSLKKGDDRKVVEVVESVRTSINNSQSCPKLSSHVSRLDRAEGKKWIWSQIDAKLKECFSESSRLQSVAKTVRRFLDDARDGNLSSSKRISSLSESDKKELLEAEERAKSIEASITAITGSIESSIKRVSPSYYEEKFDSVD